MIIMQSKPIITNENRINPYVDFISTSISKIRFNSFFKIDFFRNLLFNVITVSILTSKPIKAKIYRWGSMNLKTNEISPRTFMGGGNIEIKKDSYVNYNCFYDNLAKITINNKCIIAMHLMFCTSIHSNNNEGKVKIGDSEGKEIVIKNNCWIGATATILPGVTVGEECVITASALLTKNCPPNGLNARVPAKEAKNLV